MSFNRSPLRTGIATLVTIFAWTILAVAQEQAVPSQQQDVASKIRIKNFGQMDQRFYRGGQPKEQDYKDLAAIGIATVIDLRDDPTEYEKREVEAAGMRYVHMPMIAKKYPEQQQVEAFLKLANDPATGKFFVHCAGGRHRTGAMGAVYRFTNYGWNFDQVYKEMKQYDFYTRFGHGDFKKFVEDYWTRIQTHSASNTPISTADASAAATALHANQ
ncbi:MAG TPA: tyrosine-protein phosphatase [Pyrinomonadaceae bacterium]|jgi:protein tyrosine/serine phosphatase